METMSESKLKPTGGVEQVWGLAVAAHLLIIPKAGGFQPNAGVGASHGTLVDSGEASVVQFGDGNVTDEPLPWALFHFSPFLLSLLASCTGSHPHAPLTGSWWWCSGFCRSHPARLRAGLWLAGCSLMKTG